MSSLKLEVPVFNLLENYYIKVLEAFSDTLKEEDGVAYIEGLHVSEAERGNGHGSDMMNKLIDKCKEIGAKKITLWCEKNKWMHIWYKRLGFNDDGDKEDQEGFVWMVKELQINEE